MTEGMTDTDRLDALAARVFVLRRTEDASGVSGTGDVAEGVVFTDGTTVLRWNRAGGSTAVYDSLERMEAIHGHDGRTTVVWTAVRERDELRAADPLIIARNAHVNHMSGEADDCSGDEDVLWCDFCWTDAVAWLDPAHEFGIDADLVAALHPKDGAS